MSRPVIRVTYRIETAGDVAALAENRQRSIDGNLRAGSRRNAGAEGSGRGRSGRVATPGADDDAFISRPNASRETVYARADVDIEFPLEAVGTDLAALMTIAIGGVYSIKGLSGIRVVGMQLPLAVRGAHPGPQFGVAGVRALTGVEGRPIIGSIVKPALGLRPPETAELVRDLVEAEVDFIKDDEKLMSPAYSSLAETGSRRSCRSSSITSSAPARR